MTEELKRTTPGPWVAVPHNLYGYEINSARTGELVGMSKNIADAAIIATAPDMLDALIAIQETLMTSKETIDLEAINVMISGVFERLANEAGEEM